MGENNIEQSVDPNTPEVSPDELQKISTEYEQFKIGVLLRGAVDSANIIAKRLSPQGRRVLKTMMETDLKLALKDIDPESTPESAL